MKFERASFPVLHAWSSPFVRWQGTLADLSSIEFATAVTSDALTARMIDRDAIDRIVFGSTIPQPSQFYAAPWVTAQLGRPGITGPHIAQACATSVACIVAAAREIEIDARATPLVVTTDRTSNGPLLVWPRSRSTGGSPETVHWVLDSFACDPSTGESMLATAEHVAREGSMSRDALDELALLRWNQYRRALDDEQRFQRAYMQPVVVGQGRKALRVESDEGIHDYSAERLRALRPATEGGVVTFGGHHPADGTAGAVLCDHRRAATLSAGDGVVRLMAAAFARVERARMPKAATVAALQVLDLAGLNFTEMKFINTHNPFAVNDLWFAQQTGYPLDRMNVHGCSMIYGHPQAPTGLRGIVELVHDLRDAGGGLGMFTGCAAGDTGAALILRVD